MKMFDDIIGPRPENAKDDKLPELELEFTEEELEMDDYQKDDPNIKPADIGDVWGDVDTSNNTESPDNDDCDGSCDRCGC